MARFVMSTIMSDYESEFLYVEEPETPTEITFRPIRKFDERENDVSDASASHSQLVTLTTESTDETRCRQPDSECFSERGPTLAEEVSFAQKDSFYMSIYKIDMLTDAES